jgi:stage II sporulation protein M
MSDADPIAVQDTPGTGPAPPAGRLKGLWREEGRAWRTHYRKYFKYAARALGLGFAAGFLYFLLWPAREQKALEYVAKALEDIPVEGPPLVLALTLFYHNARASIVAVAAGAVPFLFLPILDPLVNGGVLGLVCSIAKHQGLDVPRLLLTQVLPHGIFELTAVLYATSLGLYLSMGLGNAAAEAWRRRKRRRAGEQDLIESGADGAGTSEAAGVLRNVVRSFVLVVLPLLLIAAFVEGFITPALR